MTVTVTIEMPTASLQSAEQLQALHEDWFPVRYSKSFYDGVMRGYIVTGGKVCRAAGSMAAAGGLIRSRPR